MFGEWLKIINLITTTKNELDFEFISLSCVRNDRNDKNKFYTY